MEYFQEKDQVYATKFYHEISVNLFDRFVRKIQSTNVGYI